MSKLQVTFENEKVVFLNVKTEKVEGFSYFEHIDGQSAARELRKEIDGRGKQTKAALSILIEVLQSTRLAGYQGKTELNSGLPKEFKQAMREAESSHTRPLWLSILPKSMPDDEKATTADRYQSELWAGGVYSNVKAVVSAYFCQVGRLPCMYNEDGTPDTDKLLSTDALKRLIANAKAELPKTGNDGYKNIVVRRIMAAADEFNSRDKTKKPDIVETKAAIAALETMLKAYRVIENEYAELRTKAGGSVSDIVKGTISKAQAGTVAAAQPVTA